MSHHLKTEKRDLNELVFDGRRIIVVRLPFGYNRILFATIFNIQVIFNHEFLKSCIEQKKIAIYLRTNPLS